MTSTEPNPTDVLAQKRRAASDAPSARTREDAYHLDMLRSESGRADLWRYLNTAGVWRPTPSSEEERREWAFGRAHAAALFDRLMNEHPHAVAVMWGEWAARWHSHLEKGQ